MTEIPPEDLAGENWREYLDDLRETWPAPEHRTTETGRSPPANGNLDDSTMSADANELDSSNDAQLSRRQMIARTGAAAAALGVGASAGAGTAAAASWGGDRTGLNFDSDFVPDPEFHEDPLTRSRHKMKWGVDDAALAKYADDSGDKADLGGYVPRENTENVLTVRADKFYAPVFEKFPRGEQYDSDGDGEDDTDVTALDSTHWSTTSGTNSSVTVSDADLDVPNGLTVDATVASGEQATASFTDVSITDSAEKRFMQGVVNVTGLTSGSEVHVVAIDDDGDEKVMKAVAGGDTSKTAVFASATGDGYVFQQRLADLATGGSGDGNFDSITEIEVRVIEADATVTFTAFDCEAKSEWVFGSYLKNEGTDSEERVQRVRPGPGKFTITGFDTLSEALKDDDAVVYDVEQPMRYPLSEGDGEMEFRFEDAPDYSYPYRFQMRGKRAVDTAIELTHSGISLVDTVTAPASRYVEVWSAEGVENTDFEDIGDSAKSNHGGLYDNRGADVTLRSSAMADTVYAVSFDVLHSEDNRSSATASSGGGGAPPSQQDSNAGLWGAIISLIGGTGIFALVRRMG